MEPQINADKRRLNESAEKIITAAFEISNILGEIFFEKVYYKKQSGFKLRSQIQEIIDKSSAVNLRSSAFICGLYNFEILASLCSLRPTCKIAIAKMSEKLTKIV